MEILKTIPEEVDVPHRVTLITINLEEKMAILHVEIEGKPHITRYTDLIPILEAATDPQKAVIRGFFKEILANSLQVTTGDIPDILQTT